MASRKTSRKPRMKERRGTVYSDPANVLAALHRSQAIIEFTLDGTIVTANDNFLAVMGYSLEEIQGRHHSMFVDATYRESREYKDFWARLARGEPFIDCFRRIGKGGNEIWVQATYNPVHDANGRLYKVVKFATDVTAQVLKERRIATLQSALENITSNVMVADLNLDIIYMNKTALDMMSAAQEDIRKDLPHFDASSLIGKNIDIFHKNPQHQRNLLGGLSKTFTSEMVIGGRTMRITANPLFDSEGRRAGTVVEWQDRTAEVSTEREIQTIVEAITDGKLDARIDLTGKKGFYEAIARRINSLTDTVSDVVTEIQNTVDRVNAGDRRRLVTEGKPGLFVRLATGLNSLVDTVSGLVAEIQGMVERANAGDLSRRLEKEGKPGLFVRIADGLNALIDSMSTIVANVKAASAEVSRGADEISQGNANLSQRTEEQAASLEQTASAMEQMTSTVRQNSENAAQANQLAVAAREQAEKGGGVVGKTIKAMEEINDASKKIADIIGVIDEIAFQTNLLALNAAVEAARAGEQGRGFAVVASEVRSLAGRSAKAAKEIKDLIQDSVKKVDEGSSLVTQSGAALEQIVLAVKKVSDIIAEIAAATQEQASGIDQVNKAVSQLDDMTQQNAALVEEAAAASQSLAEQARMLSELMSRYRLADEKPTAAQESGDRSTHAAASRPSVPSHQPMVERRGPGRPWSKEKKARPSGAPVGNAQPKSVALGGGDAEWEEF